MQEKIKEAQEKEQNDRYIKAFLKKKHKLAEDNTKQKKDYGNISHLSSQPVELIASRNSWSTYFCSFRKETRC